MGRAPPREENPRVPLLNFPPRYVHNVAAITNLPGNPPLKKLSLATTKEEIIDLERTPVKLIISHSQRENLPAKKHMKTCSSHKESEMQVKTVS